MADESLAQALWAAQDRLADLRAEQERRASERDEALFLLRSDRARLEEQVTALRSERDGLREEVADLGEQLTQARGAATLLQKRLRERLGGRRG